MFAEAKGGGGGHFATSPEPHRRLTDGVKRKLGPFDKLLMPFGPETGCRCSSLNEDRFQGLQQFCGFC